MITKVDFVGIPSQDPERSRAFYVETLGLRADDNARFEVWAGDTCFGIWEPARFGMQFAPALHRSRRHDLMLHHRYAPRD